VDFDAVEDDFHRALEASLEPRGPDVLYDAVAAMSLPAGSRVVDVGSGRGTHTRALADRFGLDVTPVDPAHGTGRAEALPLPDASIDLVWCRDVLTLVEDLDAAFGEFRRVLRPSGRALVYLMLVRSPDAEPVVRDLGGVPASADESRVEAAMTRAGFRIDERIEIGPDWGEYAQETEGKPGTRLLWAARLLRDPDRYVARFGREHYDTMLADCLWHVYAMIGKLHRRAYVLTTTPDEG
jgi:SAM-dependent methyltransferase